jgi:hypothetical protein
LDSFIREIEPFDCLLIAGWSPNENQLSDVIAALFDQRWGHPFAISILSNVLDALVANSSLSMVRAAYFKQSLDPETTQIFVRREKQGDLSRADIDIYTRGPDAFLVRIEHKIRGGSETVVGEKGQTFRLLKDAVGLARELRISADNVIGIFLSPGGDAAESRKFGTLSFEEMSKAVRSAITAAAPKGAELSRAAESILGFMCFYGRG